MLYPVNSLYYINTKHSDPKELCTMEIDDTEDELLRLQRELILYKRLCAELVKGNVYVTDGTDGSTHRLQVPLHGGPTTEMHWFETMGGMQETVCLSINIAHTVATLSHESMVFVSKDSVMEGASWY